VQETDPLSFSAANMGEGTETAPDSNGRPWPFQHHNATTNKDEIWVQDSFGRGSAGPIRVSDDGASPTVSPDGKTIAFVRGTGGHEQIWTVAWNGQSAQTPAGTPKQLTADARDHFFPTYSPDGGRIAYEGRIATSGSPDDVDSIAADGSGLKQESNKAGFPSYQPSNPNSVIRLEGTDRLARRSPPRKAQWKNGAAYSVVLSRSTSSPTALGAAPWPPARATRCCSPLVNHLDTERQDRDRRHSVPRAPSRPCNPRRDRHCPRPRQRGQGPGIQRPAIAGPDRYATSLWPSRRRSPEQSQNGWGHAGRVLGRHRQPVPGRAVRLPADAVDRGRVAGGSCALTCARLARRGRRHRLVAGQDHDTVRRPL